MHAELLQHLQSRKLSRELFQIWESRKELDTAAVLWCLAADTLCPANCSLGDWLRVGKEVCRDLRIQLQEWPKPSDWPCLQRDWPPPEICWPAWPVWVLDQRWVLWQNSSDKASGQARVYDLILHEDLSGPLSTMIVSGRLVNLGALFWQFRSLLEGPSANDSSVSGNR